MKMISSSPLSQDVRRGSKAGVGKIATWCFAHAGCDGRKAEAEVGSRFAQDEDPFIRPDAFELLADRKWEAAVPLLAQAVERGDRVDQGVAITALGKIGTPFALEHLVPLAPKIPLSLESCFDYALHWCGVYVTRGNGRKYFRLPGSEAWVLIGPP